MAKFVPIFHSLSKSMQNIHKASCEEISVVQSAILYEISMLKNPSMQEVARGVDMDITTFSRQIGTLEKKRFVVRIPYEGDRRIYIVSLTEQGRQLVDVIDENISAKIDKALASMNEFEREMILRSMHVLEEKLRQR